MKSIFEIAVGLLVITTLVVSCRKEIITTRNPKDLLIGQWNLYEAGSRKNGFGSFDSTSCGCLTFYYDDGISFFKDGTFSPRFNRNGTWTGWNGPSGGDNYEFNARTIILTNFPGTKDEKKLNLQLLKLDEKYLWFKHSLFVETEYHLIRNNPK